MSYDDWHAETQDRLPKRNIYSTLNKKCANDAAGKQVLVFVDKATFNAFQRTKTILKHMGEFTRHDDDHLFRVLTLMEKLLAPEYIEELSVPELMLLVLSAFFHDIGIVRGRKRCGRWKRTG